MNTERNGKVFLISIYVRSKITCFTGSAMLSSCIAMFSCRLFSANDMLLCWWPWIRTKERKFLWNARESFCEWFSFLGSMIFFFPCFLPYFPYLVVFLVRKCWNMWCCNRVDYGLLTHMYVNLLVFFRIFLK